MTNLELKKICKSSLKKKYEKDVSLTMSVTLKISTGRSQKENLELLLGL